MTSNGATEGGNGSMQAIAGPRRPSAAAPQTSASSSKNDSYPGNKEGNAFAAGSSGPSLPPISLPSGGGAIRGMGENIAMNAVQGTVSFNIPLDLSQSRRRTEPKMSLQYDSGGGGSVWGIGWNVSGVVDVTRRTRLGLPRYEDGEQEDVFVISGAEDLVPVYLRDSEGNLVNKPGSESGADYILDERCHDGFMVRQYRPRIEGLYSRVERWTDHLNPEDVHWRMISATNEMMIFGRDDSSRIVYTNGDRKNIFSWLCCEWYDCFGNARIYEYKRENSEGVDLGQANERNRTENARQTQKHLKRVKYGNRTPIADRGTASSAAAKLTPDDWMFEVVFDYGEHDIKDPKPQETAGQVWNCRRDPFSSFKAGFEIRTYRLCQRVLMFHHFAEELGRQDYLVKALEIEYQQGPAITYLKRAQQAAFMLRSANDPPPADADKGSPYFVKRLPPLVLEYTQLPTEDELQNLTLQELDGDAGLENVPEGVQGPYQWLDLLCEGINGIFTNSGGGWYYKHNLGAANESPSTQGKVDPFALGPMRIRKPKFAPLESITTTPSLQSSGQAPQFLDLEGDGSLDLAITEGPTPGFYRSTSHPATTRSSTEIAWEPFQPFRSWPTIDMNDPNLRFIDVTGDGKTDILISQDDVFVWYESLGEIGFASKRRTIPLALDEEKGPRILFSDPTETIHLADFSGDGMVDIVRVRNGDICYWPNMGYGRFGTMVMMDNAPCFDSMDAFTFQRLVLGDIDGSGTTDLIYFHDNGATMYHNLAGNAWSDPLHIESLVSKFDSLTTVAAVDLLGSGTMCLVWSSSHPSEAPGGSMRYVDLSGGQKPHLLSTVITNMGSETRLVYRPSTAYYLDDLAAGTPWATRLPYPQHCIDHIVIYDHVSKVSFSQRYCYHHGYFDSIEREFRGFGMVEQWDTERFELLNGPVDAVNQAKEVYVPPAHTKLWFHTGAFVDHEMLSRAYAKEYFGAPDPTSSDCGPAFEKFFGEQLRDQLPVNAADLSIDDMREASRAFKGALLRTEVYADDGSEKSGFPYQIVDAGNSVRMLQPRGKPNPYAVFHTFTREKLTYHLERNLEDPRIEHSLTLDVDDFGNELESAAVCYGRKPASKRPFDLEDRDVQLQSELRVTYSEKKYTNTVVEMENYRVPQPSRMRTWEVTKLMPKDASLGRFTPAEFKQVGNMLEISFDQTPDSAVPQKRLIERTETQYRRNDLSCLLHVDQQESLGLPGINYRLCITSSTKSIFQQDGENLLPDVATNLPTEGGYVNRESDGNWWIPSPQTFYHRSSTASSAEELSVAKTSFFTPQRVQDEFGTNTLMRSDCHFLQYVEIEDQLANITAGQMDYRTLQLNKVIDRNGNRTQVVRDAQGLVVGLAVMGKEGELLGDSLDGFRPNLTDDEINAYFQSPDERATTLLAGATSRFVYDVDSYMKHGADFPICASSILREIHHHDRQPSNTDITLEGLKSQIFVSYMDGYHREIQRKSQAESHPSTPNVPRWRGTGWTVFNNKGSPVQQFEPFFDEAHTFRFDRREGVSSFYLYDPLSRPIGVVLPNVTWSKQVRGAWHFAEWDVNDTVTRNVSDDEDLGRAVESLPKDALEPSWIDARKDGQKGPEEQIAAMKAKAHANTPTVTYFDCLGRAILVVKDNGPEGKISTRAVYDVNGNVLETRDGLDRIATTHRYSMCGQSLLTQSADSGSRWELVDVHGKLMRRWDSRGFRLRTEYDILRRPTDIYSESAGKEALVCRKIYGEEQPDCQVRNLRGKLFREFDQAGIATHRQWDFKGNELLVERQFAKQYKSVLNWLDISAVELEPDIYQTSQDFDALSRVITIKRPDQSLVMNGYNRGGLLQSVSGNLKGGQRTTPFVASSEYDAHGRLIMQTTGNSITTKTFDPLTQRLTNHTVVRQEGTTRTVIQNLTHTYDPAGNVTFIQNDAEQKILFRNGAVEPHSEYTYDAIYRLTEATGRENVGQTNGAPSGPGMSSSPVASSSAAAAANDGSAMVRYVEQYVYDAGNCVTTTRHQLADPKFSGWTRRFVYEIAQGRRVSNRLMSTTVGNVTENYSYDANGNMTSMPHLSTIQWDYANRMHSSSQQIVTDGIPETTWYIYDGNGQRVRKVIERQAAANVLGSPTKLQERLMDDGFEMYRQYAGDGTSVIRQCETLHVAGIEAQVAIVEDWSGGSDGAFRLIRFQFQDHVKSISVELDEEGMLLSYEEFMPYGSTSYQLPPSKAPKRFRFASKERDAENGFYYFGQRYYIPCLARWLNPDPIGIGDGLNVFEYVASNPLRYNDPLGTSKGKKDANNELKEALGNTVTSSPSTSSSSSSTSSYSLPSASAFSSSSSSFSSSSSSSSSSPSSSSSSGGVLVELSKVDKKFLKKFEGELNTVTGKQWEHVLFYSHTTTEKDLKLIQSHQFEVEDYYRMHIGEVVTPLCPPKQGQQEVKLNWVALSIAFTKRVKEGSTVLYGMPNKTFIPPENSVWETYELPILRLKGVKVEVVYPEMPQKRFPLDIDPKQYPENYKATNRMIAEAEAEQNSQRFSTIDD